MITLHQFPSAFGLPNASPFCMKVETWLRMAGLDYQVRVRHDPRNNPKGKAPVIADDDGTVVADSHFILQYLDRKYAPGLDTHLSAQDRAHARAYARMLEEGTYFIGVYSRWVDEQGWAKYKPAFFGHLPPGFNLLVPWLVRRNLRQQLHEQGTGRHSPEEIYRLGAADLEALATFLGDNPFFLGEQPSSVDATIYAFVANFTAEAAPTPLVKAARGHANLLAYCDRMKERFYHDWTPPH